MTADHPLDSRDPVTAGEAARSVFSKFRTIIDANTAALSLMADMERMLGGEYIFDRTFLEKSARTAADLVHQTVYALNAMSDNGYIGLYDRFMAIAAAVEDILAGRQGEDDERAVRALSRLRLEDRPQVGREAAALGELAGHLGIAVPAGVALARPAWDNGRLAEAGKSALAQALERENVLTAAPRLALTLTMTAPDGRAVRNERHGTAPTLQAALAALEELAASAREALSVETGPVRACALVIPEPASTLRGEIDTYCPAQGGLPLLRLGVWASERPEDRDTVWLERSHPFGPRRGIYGQRALKEPLPDGPVPLDPAKSGFLRGSALLPFEAASGLAGQAMACERLLGSPLTLTWYRDADGHPVIDSVRPQEPADGGTFAVTPLGEPLLGGGEAACLGIASGAVVHVDEHTPAMAFPFGAIAVARSASPSLAPLLRRAGAILTEVGDAAGHLAAVAREFRVPALFGLRGATGVLAQGDIVTVDAGAGEVRAGATALPPREDSGLTPEDPEYLTLRRLLRRIAALHLTDPDAASFSVEGCRSFHDILHFAHDKATGILAALQLSGASRTLARPLPLPLPLDLRVLDIGGGFDETRQGVDAVRSRPLAAFLSGMLTPGMWDTTPAKMGLGEIIGAMAKAAPTGSGNLAIAARSYANVSLRLGYHFTVIDAYVGRNPDKNAVYFRFVGGMAGPAGREARALFLRRVLARSDFKVTAEGDLVVARLKMVEAASAEEALRLLGRLCAFARQRDTGMAGPADAEALEQAFFDACADSQHREGSTT